MKWKVFGTTLEVKRNKQPRIDEGPTMDDVRAGTAGYWMSDDGPSYIEVPDGSTQSRAAPRFRS